MNGRILLVFILFLACTGITVLNGSFEIAAPSVRLAILVAVFFVAASALLYRYGVKGTVLLAVPYAVVLLVLEVGVRIWVANFGSDELQALFLTPFSGLHSFSEQSTYVPHHYTLYGLRPDLAREDGTVHNRLGLRDHRSLSNASGRTRIVFIGGSTTYTVGLKDNKRIFTSRLEQRLNEHYRQQGSTDKIEIVNAGMPGATSAENLLRLIFFVSETDPDLVVIQHGLNDIWPRVRKNITTDFSNYRKMWEKPDYFEQAPIAYGLVHMAVEQSAVLTFLARRFEIIPQATVGDMVTRKDVPHGTRYLSENSTVYFERNTRFMIEVCRAMGARVLLATEAYSQDAGKMRLLAMPEHNALIARIAKEERVWFYDFHEEMTKDARHMPDGRHVNQQGSDLKADLFFSFFLRHDIVTHLQRN
jgi:lysophospholipase L1-like esterase